MCKVTRSFVFVNQSCKWSSAMGITGSTCNSFTGCHIHVIFIKYFNLRQVYGIIGVVGGWSFQTNISNIGNTFWRWWSRWTWSRWTWSRWTWSRWSQTWFIAIHHIIDYNTHYDYYK